jgi:hypothetical protein
LEAALMQWPEEEKVSGLNGTAAASSARNLA